jgi:hypothetical protein
MTKLIELTDDILGAEPDQPEALKLRDLANQAISHIQHPVEGKQPLKPWLDVQERFEQGDLAGTRALAEACAPRFKQCKALLQNLALFEKQFKNVDEATLPQLQALAALSRKLTGGPLSPLIATRTHQVTADLIVKGQNLWSDGKYAQSLKQVRLALSLEPDDLEAKRFLDDARVFAMGLLSSVDQEEPEDAVSRLRAVMDMTAADDELHARAKARLAARKR